MSLPLASRERILSLAVFDSERAETLELIAQYDRAYPTACPIQSAFIEQAIAAAVNQTRCRRVHGALIGDKAWCSKSEFSRAEFDRVESHIPKLNTDPYMAIRAIEQSAAGCRYALTRWEYLQGRFREDQTLFGADRVEFCSLLGLRAGPDDLFFSEDAYLFWVYGFRAERAPDSEMADWLGKRTVMPMTIQGRLPEPWPPPPDVCRARIQEVFDRELPRLRTLAETLRRDFEVPALAIACERALAKTSRNEMQLLRELRSHERSYREATTALLKVPSQAGRGLLLPEGFRIAGLCSQPLAEWPCVNLGGRGSGRAVPECGSPGGSPSRDCARGFSDHPGDRSASNQQRIAVAGGYRPLAKATSRSFTLAGNVSPAAKTQTLSQPQTKDVTPMDEQEILKYQEIERNEPLSQARLDANRMNSCKSTGPRSIAGKAASRLNGARHHMCSNLDIVPGESAEELRERHERWQAAYQADSDPLRYLVERAVKLSWKIDRCDRADTAETTANMYNLADTYYDSRAAAVKKLTPQLAADPAGVMEELRNSSAGLVWALDQVDSLDDRLVSHLSFEPSQLNIAAYLHGWRPVELVTNVRLTELALAYVEGLRGRGNVDAQQAAIVLADFQPEHVDFEEFERRLGLLIATLKTVDDGHRTLQEILADLRRDLTERLELILAREGRNLNLAIVGQTVDTSDAGMKRHRYLTSYERALKSTIREIRAVQKDRREQGLEPQDEAVNGGEAPVETASAAPEGAETPAAAKLRTEAKTSDPARPVEPVQPTSEGITSERSGAAPAVARGPTG